MKPHCPLLLLAFFIVQGSLAQIQSGEIIYKVRPPKSLEVYTDTSKMETSSRVKMFFVRRYRNIKNTAQHLRFSLLFNKNESRFQKEPGMANDNGMDIEKAARATGVYGLYYVNDEENLSLNQYSSPLLGKLILVSSDLDSPDWIIKKDRRNIAGFSCQKAEAVIHHDPEKNIKLAITAWFAPDLPFQFGPLGHGGLPGMILGLEKRHFYFYADKIDLRKTKQKIKRPTKGKKITQQKLETLQKEHEQNVRKRYEEMKKR